MSRTPPLLHESTMVVVSLDDHCQIDRAAICQGSLQVTPMYVNPASPATRARPTKLGRGQLCVTVSAHLSVIQRRFPNAQRTLGEIFFGRAIFSALRAKVSLDDF